MIEQIKSEIQSFDITFFPLENSFILYLYINCNIKKWFLENTFFLTNLLSLFNLDMFISGFRMVEIVFSTISKSL